MAIHTGLAMKALWRRWTANARQRRLAEKLALLAGMSAVITLMVSPNLDLVAFRYEEGDIISQDIVIPDNITLPDQRSTEARRQEAIADFPPIYDHDPELKARIVDRIRTVFAEARQELADMAQTRVEWQNRLRTNSLEKISALSSAATLDAELGRLQAEKDYLVGEIGVLADREERSEEQSLRLEKLRFDLIAVDAHLSALEQARAQVAQRREQLAAESAQLLADYQQSQVEEDSRIAGIRSNVEETLRISLEDPTFQVLLQARFNEDLENKILLLIDPVLDRRIVSSLDSFSPPGEAIQIQALDTGEVARFENLAGITDVPQVRASLEQRAEDLGLFGEAGLRRQAVVSLARQLVQPNLTENKALTEQQKQELARSINPVYFNLKKGEVVARAGERATTQQVEIIRALNTHNLQNPKYPQLIGTFLIIFLALGLFYQFVALRGEAELRSFSRLTLMSILLLIPLLIGAGVLLMVPGLTMLYDLLPPPTYNYLIPAALASMLGGILLGFEVGVFLGFAVSLALAILLDSSLSFFIFSLMGSFVAALPMREFDNRYALFRQGLRISAINVPVIVVLTLIEQGAMGYEFGMNLAAGFLNGLVVAFLASTLLPFFESAFDITTSLRLLELSNMNHPALKELAVRAPGTYHHSIVVGNLAESGADGIGANSLLVRVASYYHDLGKMLCPLYFVENQNNRNYHDDLPAKTSARIIISHVRNGLAIARRHRLGRAICDILAQHHGTSLVRYFFHKAEEEQKDLETPLDESEFRYPGPKPQTKEAGVVMLADVTESATRSLEDPSDDTIRRMVQRQATRIYSEGQLDESGMTFNDLNFIEKAFTRILLSVHHHRITYPELREVVRVDHALDKPDAGADTDTAEHRDLPGSKRHAG